MSSLSHRVVPGRHPRAAFQQQPRASGIRVAPRERTLPLTMTSHSKETA